MFYKLSLMFAFLSLFYESWSEFCGQGILNETEGVIKTSLDINKFSKCLLVYITPNNSITTLRSIEIHLENCERNTCCNDTSIEIRSVLKRPYNICNDIKNFQGIVIREQYFYLYLKSKSTNIIINIEYSTRSDDMCPEFEFMCFDRIRCYHSINRCDGIFQCDDHSDELSCGNCQKNQTPCDYVTKTCFDPKIDRCNKINECPGGEDEINCEVQNLLESKIKLKNQTKNSSCDTRYFYLCDNGKCINKTLAKNQNDACSEKTKEGGFSGTSLMAIILLAAIFLSAVFICLIYRWCKNRRDIQRLLDNLPEFPLPPFEGPGEEECSETRFSEADFRNGGEIFDAFIQTRRRLQENCRRSSRTNLVTSRRNSYIWEYSDNQEAALASLDVPLEKCIGLELIIESEEDTTDSVDHRFSPITERTSLTEEESFCSLKQINGLRFYRRRCRSVKAHKESAQVIINVDK